MRQKFFTLIALFCLATGMTYAQEDDLVLFEENFSEFAGKGGNDGNLGHNSDNAAFDVTITKEPNWTVHDAKMADNCASFYSAFKWSDLLDLLQGKLQTGYIQTRAINGGNNQAVTLSFKACGFMDELTNEYFGSTSKLTVYLNGKEIDSREFVAGEFTFVTVDIPNFPEGSVLKFEVNKLFATRTIYVDEIKVVKKYITLNEAADNTNTINDNKDNLVNVKLLRKLATDHWNTFCVPFDISQEKIDEAFGNGTRIKEFDHMEDDGTTMVFTDAKDGIKAGVPVLIWPTTTTTDPLFTRVTIPAGIVAEGCETTIGDYAYVGKYSPAKMKTDKSEQFLGAGHELYYPDTDAKATINGMRAFFRLPEEGQTNAKVSIDDNGTTGIDNVGTEVAPKNKVYSINGAYMGTDVKSLGNGLYIVNGKKILVK